MKNPPGYLLPDGDAFTADLACCLVFYPDKPEYRRALTGSLAYLSTWLAWERDSAKRGQDAARAWKNALDETLECMNMACLEDLISDVETIRILMENKKDCCDDNVTYFPTEDPTTEIEPEIGDPPEFYGETAVADWDDWAEHVCYNAHKYVDYMKGTAGELNQAVLLSTIYIGIISAALTLLAFSGIGLPIAYGIAAAIVADIALSATAETFEDSADDFENARATIVCAIVKGYSLPDAIEGALGSDVAWDLFYQFIDYESAIAIIYEGGYGTEYLPAETRDDCSCEGVARFEFDFAIDEDGWISAALTFLWDANEYITATPSNTGQWKSVHFWTWTALATRFSFGLPVAYDQVKFKFNNHSDSGSAVRQLFQFYIYDGDDVAAISPEWDTDDFTDDEWHQITWNLDETFSSGVASNHALTMRMYRYGAVTALRRMWIDDFGIWLKA